MIDIEQQAKNVLELFGVSFSAKYNGKTVPPYWVNETLPHSCYRVTFTRLKPRSGEMKSLSINWYASICNPKKCTPYDVLATLCKTEYENLYDWLVETGYPNSLQARLAFKAWQREAKCVNRFFSRENEMRILYELN